MISSPSKNVTARLSPCLLLAWLLMPGCKSPSKVAPKDMSDNPRAADVHTPAVIATILQTSRPVTWAALPTTPTNLTRFSVGPQGATALIAVDDTSTSVNAALITEAGMTERDVDTMDRLLRVMFKFVEVEGGFRIMSTKHPMYALDASGDDIVISDIRSLERAADAGYLVFTLQGTGSAATLTASGRHVWDQEAGTFVALEAWEARGVGSHAKGLSLAETPGTLTIYAPPIDLDLPVDLNPDNSARVSNPEFLARDEGPNRLDDLTVSNTYAPQITARGNDPATAMAAASMLSDIEAALEAEGASMRYPSQLYLTWREGMLARTLVSAGTFDGSVGQRSVPYVYFTNETDTNGVHHPFMVIATYGLPDTLSLLWDIPRPPGDGRGGGYDNESVTRIVVGERFLTKIPLRDYGQVSSLTENKMLGSLADDERVTQYDHHNYASVSATGVAIDGVVIYPSYNNRLQFAQSEGELSAHGMHAGRGLDAHYHSDAHSASGEGLNLYNAADYIGHTHPPIISMGFDGIAGYGVYPKGDTSLDGWDVALDAYAAHSHDGYGYHYHSTTKTETTARGTSYTAHMLPPRGAWAGRINDIPAFWLDNRPDYANTGQNPWVGQN